MLKELFKVISFFLSIPASSAFVERLFSVMKAKWRDDRNRSSVDLIKSELLVYFNINVKCTEVHDFFLKNKTLIEKSKSQNKYGFKEAGKENRDK